MQHKFAAVALAVAGTASAQRLGEAHNNIIAARNEIARVVEARQTVSIPACLTALESIGLTAPTPPPAILSWEESDTQTNPCSFTVPASLSSDYAAYESSLMSWATAHSADVLSALSQCPQYSSYATAYTGLTGSPTCGSGPTATGGSGSGTTATTASSGSTTTGGSGSGSGSGSGTTSSSGSGATSATKNAGPQETAFLTGALAAAGLIAAVAVAL